MAADLKQPSPVPLAMLTGLQRCRNCKADSWHHCAACVDFDFCFRCVLDKEIIYCEDTTNFNERMSVWQGLSRFRNSRPRYSLILCYDSGHLYL